MQESDSVNHGAHADWRRVVDVAAAHRGIFTWFGLFYLSLIIAQIVIEPRFVRLAGLAGTVVSYGLLLSLRYQLVTGINDRTPYLWVGLMALPCLNVVTLFILNSKAINWLDPHDLEMGLIGAFQADD